MITNVQIRAARALLGWDQARLAEEAGVSVITVKRVEGAEDGFHARYETVMKIRRAVEKSGIEFLNAHGQIGVVRLAPKRR